MSRGIIKLPLVEAIQTEIMFLCGDTFSLYFFHIFILELWGTSDSAGDPYM